MVGDAAVAMTRSYLLPTAGTPYLYFHHSYEFEAGFDGATLEYSTNGGSTWNDAGHLIDAGTEYNGRLNANNGNPLSSRLAFTGNSFGYTATRLNLSALKNRRVRFRFRIGTDQGTGSFGWAIDDMQLYRCQ